MVFLLSNFSLSLSLLTPRYHCEAVALRLQWREKKKNPDSTRLDLIQNLGPYSYFNFFLVSGDRGRDAEVPVVQQAGPVLLPPVQGLLLR